MVAWVVVMLLNSFGAVSLRYDFHVPPHSIFTTFRAFTEKASSGLQASKVCAHSYDLQQLAHHIAVITIVGIIILGIIVDAGGGPQGEAIGFRYWNNPGAFNQYRKSYCITSVLACC